MTHNIHTHMLQDNDHSPAGVGCCEVVSDDVFSLSLTSAVEGRGDKGKRMERGTERESGSGWRWGENVKSKVNTKTLCYYHVLHV